MDKDKPIIAVCGKGGVGKTAFAALLSRVLLDANIQPLLLIDADPAGGLVSAIGERVTETLAGVREELIAKARGADDVQKTRMAEEFDYLVMKALQERPGYSLLAMGHPKAKGCFCPANTLLREAIDLLAAAFALVMIDAEAGLEQLHRQVTRRVNRVITLTDGSALSSETLDLIAKLVERPQLAVVVNRTGKENSLRIPNGAEFLGTIQENQTLQELDRQGQPHWDLPRDNQPWAEVKGIARRLGFMVEE